ncbi:MAG: alpha-galactosidase [Acidobacteriaceae bacterium]
MDRFLIACSLLAGLTWTANASAQNIAILKTGQTILRFKAGEKSPQLISLQAPGEAAWKNRAGEELIGSAKVDGSTVPLHWKLDASAGRVDAKHVSFVYESASPRMRLTWEWRAPAAIGPIEHRIRIENLTSREIWIPLQASFRFNCPTEATASLEHVYVDKGAGTPTAIGTHQATMPVGYQWEGTSSTYAGNGQPREIVPWFMLQRNGRAEDGWYVGVEFSGRVSLTLKRDANSIHGVVGLNPDPPPFFTRLLPQEAFDAPPIFLGAFVGGRDNLGNVLRPWVRHVLTNVDTWKNPDYPLLVNNSWGSGMQVNETLAKQMIRDSAELGLEMFHLDAGWFRGVGDWYPNPNKFPHGLASLSDYAHQHGLKFGVWADWAQAGIGRNPGALNVHDPKVKDWLVADVPAGWKPDPFVGRTIDLGVPAAKEYAEEELKRIVGSYKLDMLEHDGYVVTHTCARADHPHAAPPASYISTVTGSGAAMPLTSNSTDVSYHAARAYYGIYSRLRREHPGLLLEICDDGGRMVDFGSASHGDYFSITDTYDPLSNRRAFYDASQVLPAAMLEDYVEKWPTPKIQNFLYMLRSGMMGWLTVMQDTNAWTPEQHAAAKEEFALYKSQLRPFIRDADLYHISERPNGVRWDGIEYFDPQRARGVVYSFRGSAQQEDRHAFPLKGLLPDRQYRLHFHDRTASDETVSGRELLDKGLTVTLPIPNSSELIFIDQIGSLGAQRPVQ